MTERVAEEKRIGYQTELLLPHMSIWRGRKLFPPQHIALANEKKSLIGCEMSFTCCCSCVNPDSDRTGVAVPLSDPLWIHLPCNLQHYGLTQSEVMNGKSRSYFLFFFARTRKWETQAFSLLHLMCARRDREKHTKKSSPVLLFFLFWWSVHPFSLSSMFVFFLSIEKDTREKERKKEFIFLR